jgi:NAD(P)-dependent dehydrogenase (short-subunit alcohol dehydrogenase family)
MTNDNTNNSRRRFLGQVALAAGASSIASFGSSAGSAKNKANPTPAPLSDVAGKVAFITGGSSGIGLGQARVFHEAGMKVVIGYIRDDQVGSALEQFRSGRDRIHAIKVNVTDRRAMRRAADEIEDRFGAIHLVSNNAGIGLHTPLSVVDYQDFDQTLGVNLVGVFNGVKEFLPRIRKHGQGGHIVTTSSMSGLLPTEGAGAGVYTTTKFATIGMMEALRSEMDAEKANVGVSVYCPGFVNTNIFEVDRNLSASYSDGPKRSEEAINAAAARENNIRTIMGAGMDPMEAGRFVLDGIRNNDLFILSHPEFNDGLKERHEAIIASLPRGVKAPESRLKVIGVTLHNSVYKKETAKLRSRGKRQA